MVAKSEKPFFNMYLDRDSILIGEMDSSQIDIDLKTAIFLYAFTKRLLGINTTFTKRSSLKTKKQRKSQLKC